MRFYPSGSASFCARENLQMRRICYRRSRGRTDTAMQEKMTLTQEQKKAIAALGRSVVVEAGAGSGQTEVLVWRFCRIVEQGKAGVEEILLLAPTERSAGEIRERIACRIRDRQALAFAHIGTIHAFCNRVLRENAVEAGIDPRFSVLDDTRRRVMANRILDEMIGSGKADAASGSASSLQAGLVEELGTDAVKDAILTLDRAAGDTSAVTDTNPAPFLEAFERCSTDLSALAESAEDVPMKVMEGIEAGLVQAKESAERLLASCDEPEFDWDDFRLLQKYSYRFAASRGAPAIRQQIRAARDALRDFLAACLDCLSACHAGLIRDMAAEFHERYVSAKARLGLLDYDDLLEKTLDLLYDGEGQVTEIARRYRERFKFVMLADSQDIGRDQRRIIQAVSRPGGMFAIGDDRQSVFGFTRSETRFACGESEHANTVKLRLRDNFRSRRGILDFINAFFGEIWSEDRDITHDELRFAGRFDGKSAPDVEVVLLPRPRRRASDGGIEQALRDEAHIMAHRILEMTGANPPCGEPVEPACSELACGEPVEPACPELVEGVEPVMHTRDGHAGQPISLGDIMILLRSAGGMSIYEQALQQHGIPACAVGVRGFYSAREVQDILCLLKVVDDPMDDVAMASVLWSPIVGIAEEALFNLCSAALESGEAPRLSENTGGLWNALCRVDDSTAFDEADRSRLLAFRAMLNDLILSLPESEITDILDLALEKTGLDLRLLASQGGRRKYANVRKLCEIAQEWGSSGRAGLRGFIVHIQELERSAHREAEAAIWSERGDAVRIMTVHRAMGLQSPVVFVGDMSRPLFPKPGLFVFDPDWGPAIQVRNPATDRYEIPLRHREIFEDLRDRAVAEEKRLLYMAMTRAEEHLVLVGSGDLRGEHKPTYQETDSWSGWLGKALNLGPGTPEGTLRFGAGRVAVRYGPPIRWEPPSSRAPTLAEEFASALQEGLPIEMEISPAAFSVAEAAVRRCLGEKPSPARRLSRLSVSQALDYLECPARYRLIHIIGMPDDGGEPPDDVEEPGFAAADLGHLVHDLLADVDFSRDVGPQIRALISDIPDALLKAQARQILERFIESRWCDELRASRHIIKEMPFEIALDGRVLAGRMDALYRSRDGWTILDYKTGRAETRERYELQVGIYAYATQRLIGEPPSRAALLILSSGDEWIQDTSDGSTAQLAAGRISEVAAAIDAGRFDPNPGKACEWCAFSSRCGRHMAVK
jgi:ATP-dependent helicase/nuclease subunit A